jgi:hypothetical protein
VFKQITLFYKFVFLRLLEKFMKQTNKKRRLFEDDEIFGTTDAMPLSTVPGDAAKAAYKGGKADGDEKDDQIPSAKVSVAAAKLKPSQKEVVPQKAVEFAFSAIMKIKPMESGPGGDLQAIISNDDYIMDGHHRWAATFLVDPSAALQATQIDLPGAALVTALNVVTKGLGRGGNTGKGDISKFGGKPIEDAIDAVLANGYWAESDPEKCKEAFVKWGGGTVEDAKAKMVANAAKMPKAIPGWAPNRVDMPVINAPEVATIAKAIAAGAIDLKKPYGDDVKSKMESYYQMRIGKKPLTETTMKILRNYNTKNQKRLQESFLKKVKKQKLEEKLTELIKPMIVETLKKIVKNKKR